MTRWTPKVKNKQDLQCLFYEYTYCRVREFHFSAGKFVLNCIWRRMPGEIFYDIQRGIQNPAKHLRWSVYAPSLIYDRILNTPLIPYNQLCNFQAADISIQLWYSYNICGTSPAENTSLKLQIKHYINLKNFALNAFKVNNEDRWMMANDHSLFINNSQHVTHTDLVILLLSLSMQLSQCRNFGDIIGRTECN